MARRDGPRPYRQHGEKPLRSNTGDNAMRAGMTGGGMRMGLMGMGCGLVAVVTVAEAGPPTRSANPGNVAILRARG